LFTGNGRKDNEKATKRLQQSHELTNSYETQLYASSQVDSGCQVQPQDIEPGCATTVEPACPTAAPVEPACPTNTYVEPEPACPTNTYVEPEPACPTRRPAGCSQKSDESRNFYSRRQQSQQRSRRTSVTSTPSQRSCGAQRPTSPTFQAQGCAAVQPQPTRPTIRKRTIAKSFQRAANSACCSTPGVRSSCDCSGNNWPRCHTHSNGFEHCHGDV